MITTDTVGEKRVALIRVRGDRRRGTGGGRRAAGRLAAAAGTKGVIPSAARDDLSPSGSLG